MSCLIQSNRISIFVAVASPSGDAGGDRRYCGRRRELVNAARSEDDTG
jgi:hypothetical protein